MPQTDITQLNAQTVLIIGSIDPEEIRTGLNVSLAEYQLVGAETIKIEQIRELIHWLNIKPMNAHKKLAVILGAENMNAESANALLKTLEEPPSYVQIILNTMNEQRILPTIQSRCAKIRVLSDRTENLPQIYLSPDALAKKDIKERFSWAAAASELEPEEIKSIVTAWQMFFRENLLSGQNKISILNDLNTAKDLLQTNISVKLLLENLTLKF